MAKKKNKASDIIEPIEVKEVLTDTDGLSLAENQDDNLNDGDSKLVRSEEKSDTNSSHALVPIANTGNFGNYLQSINQAPKLTAKEEWELAKRLRTHNDLEAAQKLVFCNLRYVISIAKGYHGYGLNLPDLVQEGNVGLMLAVKRFNPEKKVKFMTFASYWIKAEIHEFILHNWRIVKMATTKAQRKLFFKLRSTKDNLDWMDDEEAKNVAKKLEVSVKDVYQMEGRMGQNDVAFDLGDDDDEDAVSPSQYLPDLRYNPERLVANKDTFDRQKRLMLAGIKSLDERSQDVIKERWLSDKKITLKTLSERHKVSLERIRQIEASALLKLRNQMQ